LLGLIKDFWVLLLDPPAAGRNGWFRLPLENRRVLKARGRSIKMTQDHGRPYRCIVDDRGFWVMESWMTWTEVVSVFLLQPFKKVIRDSGE
jgi:hypothetical protein